MIAAVMRSLCCISVFLFFPLLAVAATGTIPYERVEITCPASICTDGNAAEEAGDVNYTFTPGGDNVIDVLSTSDLTQRFFTYKAVVSHAVSAQADEEVEVQCQGDTNVEGGPRIFFTTDSVPAGQRNRTNFALPENRVTVNLPPRSDPGLEVVYTFTCDLVAGSPRTSFASSEIVVRQNTIVHQSVEVLEVTPPGVISGQPLPDPPPAPLTPDTRQDFNVRVRWEENSIVVGGRLRMTFLAADGPVVGTGGAPLNRLQDGEFLQANEQELVTSFPVLIPADSSTLTLRVELFRNALYQRRTNRASLGDGRCDLLDRGRADDS